MNLKDKILELVPKTCESCGAPLKLSADLMHLTCTNPDCGGSLYRRIEIMAKAFDIPNIGVKTAKEMVEQIPLKAEYELFDVTVEDLLRVGRFQEGMAEKIYNSIHSVTSVPFAKFLKGCRISRVGDGTAEDLAGLYSSMDELLSTDMFSLKRKYDKAGDGLAQIIVSSLRYREPVIRSLMERVDIVYPMKVSKEKDMSDILAVVTGSLHFGSRTEFQNYFKSKYGIRWTSSVSRNVKYLIINEESDSKKYRDAKGLQEAGYDIKIITEREFLEMLGEKSSVETLLKSTAEAAKVSAELDMFEDFKL